MYAFWTQVGNYGFPMLVTVFLLAILHLSTGLSYIRLDLKLLH